MWCIRRSALSGFGFPVPCQYVRRQHPRNLRTGYLVIEYIEESVGNMLSNTWEEHRHDKIRRMTLFSDLSRIMLSLAQSPLPRIGSLTINKDGVLCLRNRPLTLQLHQLENEGIPTNIDRNLTYSTTETYILDLLQCHDSKILNQPNSILNESDGLMQLSALTAMRALLPHFVNRDLRYGHFVLTLTDLHQSNIFVDEDWHIKCLVDLEWACSRPLEMLHPPSWLTGRAVDQLNFEHLEPFTRVYEEFVDAFEQQENLLPCFKDSLSYRTRIMRRGWTTGNFWYFAALKEPGRLCNVFLNNIQPIFGEVDKAGRDEFDRIFTPYWSVGAKGLIAAKIKEKEAYEDQLRRRFESSVQDENASDLS
jgi:hypothetical protein